MYPAAARSMAIGVSTAIVIRMSTMFSTQVEMIGVIGPARRGGGDASEPGL